MLQMIQQIDADILLFLQDHVRCSVLDPIMKFASFIGDYGIIWIILAAVLLISHDLGVIRQMCTRVYIMYAGRVVESGETKEVLAHPLHPYTQALISNCASIDLDEKREPIRIEGEPPSPVDPKPCCPFAGCCFCEQEICRREKPQLRHMADGRVVACHLVKEK